MQFANNIGYLASKTVLDVPTGKLISLLDIMKKFDAGRWLPMVNWLHGTEMYRRDTEPVEDPAEQRELFRLMQSECEALGLTFSVCSIERIIQALEAPLPLTNIELAQMATELGRRIQDEIASVLFLRVPADGTRFYEQKEPLFDASDIKVSEKFPSASSDIAEAGKCFALGRYTASVFHLMRVMEIAVQRFGEKLGIQKIDEKSWYIINDKISSEVKTLISQMKEKTTPEQTKIKKMAAASAHLNNVRVAWRNEVAHPKQTYTEEEARNIFNHVKIFMQDLARIL